jgi:flavin-dependent dehydrogenase
MKNAQIVILGAGPAGSAAALKLSQLGIPCVLIDKAVFPRDKICGDGISNQCVHVLQKWLDPSLVARFAAANHLQIDSWGLQVEGTKGNGFEIPYKPFSAEKTEIPTGFVCKRRDFDNFLVEEVRRSPLIEFYENVEISQFEKISDSKFQIPDSKKFPWESEIWNLKSKNAVYTEGSFSELKIKNSELKIPNDDATTQNTEGSFYELKIKNLASKTPENTPYTEGSFSKLDNGFLLTDKSGNFKITTQLVIAADGAQSRFARQIGGIELDNQHFMASVKAYYTGVTGFHKDNFLEFYFLKDFLPGYFWIFPLPNGEANVGIAIVSEDVSKRKLNLKQCLEEVINTRFKDRFTDAKINGKVEGFGLPLGSKRRKLSGDNYILTGDAASLIDPLTGEGIANALLSGVVAAEKAAECLAQNDFSETKLKEYDARIYRMRGQEFKVSYWLQRQFRRAWFFDSLVWLISKNQHLARTFAFVFTDVNLKNQLRKPSFWWNILRNKKIKDPSV